jgi:hypothetical protein
MPLKTVKATREGLVGQKTASGYLIEKTIPFVALPSTAALHRVVRVTRELPATSPLAGQHLSINAIVLDVGPWNTHDSQYVFGDARPQAESGTDLFGRATNGAGIDLGEAVWNALDMTDNGEVSWDWA